MKLHQDWKRIIRKAWSVRLALGAALLSALEAGWTTWTTGQPAIVAWITAGISVSAAVARLVAQPKSMGGGDA